MDYHGLSLTIIDYHGLSWTIMDYHGLSLTIIEGGGMADMDDWHGMHELDLTRLY